MYCVGQRKFVNTGVSTDRMLSIYDENLFRYTLRSAGSTSSFRIDSMKTSNSLSFVF